MSIMENISQVQANIAAAVQRRGTDTKVKLVAVTKNHSAAMVDEALQYGIDCVGENRVQEAEAKAAQVQGKAAWHLIGHLQRNKVKPAMDLFTLIHSVDSERLADAISKTAVKMGRRQDILVQVNVAGETTKFGISLPDVEPLLKKISLLPGIHVRGLMTIAPFYDDPEQTRPIFRSLYQLYRRLQENPVPGTDFEWLSMGMSHDYVVAVEEGANMVRVGTAIFGARNYNADKGGI